MAVLRLFASAREAAGTATDEVPGQTVDEVLDAARGRYGPGFAAVLGASRVWRNGAPAEGSDLVEADDEVAVLPPVSGGSEPSGARRPRPVAEDLGPQAARRQPAPPPAGVAASSAGRPGRSGPPSGRGARPGGGAPAGEGAPSTGRGTPGGRPSKGRSTGPAPPRTRATEARPSSTRPTSGRASGASAPPRRRRPRPAPEPAAPSARRRASRQPGSAAPPGASGRSTAARAAPRARRAGPGDPDRTAALTRQRSVDTLAAGVVEVRGQPRPVRPTGSRRTAFGRRYAAVHDTSGPNVSLGVAWFAAVVVALAIGWPAVTLLYAVAAGWAALEAAGRWREVGVATGVWVAALGAAAVGASAASGPGALGLALIALVLAAWVAAVSATGRRGRNRTLGAAGATVLGSAPFGLAAAGVVAALDADIGAAVVLVLFVSAYEASDFLIGSGSSNSLEGPLSGMVAIGVTALAVAVLEVPPFDGAPVFTFAALAAVGCPLGQLACSALLPAADARAPAARRLDSLLVLAPLWALAVAPLTG